MPVIVGELPFLVTDSDSSFLSSRGLIAVFTAPSGLSAISLTSWLDKTSDNLEARDFNKIVAGPWN